MSLDVSEVFAASIISEKIYHLSDNRGSGSCRCCDFILEFKKNSNLYEIC
jgi:hypothetical protein